MADLVQSVCNAVASQVVSSLALSAPSGPLAPGEPVRLTLVPAAPLPLDVVSAAAQSALARLTGLAKAPPPATVETLGSLTGSITLVPVNGADTLGGTITLDSPGDALRDLLVAAAAAALGHLGVTGTTAWTALDDISVALSVTVNVLRNGVSAGAGDVRIRQLGRAGATPLANGATVAVDQLADGLALETLLRPLVVDEGRTVLDHDRGPLTTHYEIRLTATANVVQKGPEGDKVLAWADRSFAVPIDVPSLEVPALLLVVNKDLAPPAPFSPDAVAVVVGRVGSRVVDGDTIVLDRLLEVAHAVDRLAELLGDVTDFLTGLDFVVQVLAAVPRVYVVNPATAANLRDINSDVEDADNATLAVVGLVGTAAVGYSDHDFGGDRLVSLTIDPPVAGTILGWQRVHGTWGLESVALVPGGLPEVAPTLRLELDLVSVTLDGTADGETTTPVTVQTTVLGAHRQVDLEVQPGTPWTAPTDGPVVALTVPVPTDRTQVDVEVVITDNRVLDTAPVVAATKPDGGGNGHGIPELSITMQGTATIDPTSPADFTITAKSTRPRIGETADITLRPHATPNG